MKSVHIKTHREAQEYVVICRSGAFKELALLREKIGSRGILVFTDENVSRLYGNKIRKYLCGVPVFIMPAGEEHKTEETLFALLKAMAENGLRRNSALIALGGGVVGDIGGLAAALYMRGIDCYQVPTTLLSQVDSSVGGKTAIDFCGIKNLIGAFKQPCKVFADPAFFKTLPLRELKCGLGEIIKHGALDGEIFDLLWAHRDNLFDLNFLGEIVPDNVAFKADVVKKDPHEKSLRKCLNLGHTTAHALELADGKLSHGEYVLIGTIIEAEIARRKIDCDGEYLDRLIALSKTVLGDIPRLPFARAAASARLDKKNINKDMVVLSVPVRRGEYALLELDFADYAEELAGMEEVLC